MLTPTPRNWRILYPRLSTLSLCYHLNCCRLLFLFMLKILCQCIRQYPLVNISLQIFYYFIHSFIHHSSKLFTRVRSVKTGGAMITEENTEAWSLHNSDSKSHRLHLLDTWRGIACCLPKTFRHATEIAISDIFIPSVFSCLFDTDHAHAFYTATSIVNHFLLATFYCSAFLFSCCFYFMSVCL